MAKEKYILFDGNNLSHIAFHRAKSIVFKEIAEELDKKPRDIDPTNDLTDDNMKHILGMTYHVFFLKIHKIFKRFSDGRFMFAWDAAGSSDWRKERYPEYKSNRVYTEDPTWKLLFEAIDEIKKVLVHYPVYQAEFHKLEADDILYAYAKHMDEDKEVIIVSTDSDLLQIAQKFNAKVFHPLKQKFSRPPKEYDICVFKAIKGEEGDGIPGIKGFGDKKSERLATDYQGDENAINETLNEEQREIFYRNIELIDISNNPNLDKVVLELDKIEEATNYIDFDEIRKFYFKKGLKELMSKFDSVIDVFPNK
jgi:DNA polymerase-1